MKSDSSNISGPAEGRFSRRHSPGQPPPRGRESKGYLGGYANKEGVERC